MDEALVTPDGQVGLELVRVAVPLVCGVSVHSGLATALRGGTEEESIRTATLDYATTVTGRGLEIDELESQSYTFQEQQALTEGLVRLGVRRVIPRLKETFEILQVEVMDKRTLYTDASPWPSDRCGVCGGPLAGVQGDGCTLDECGLRPAPAIRADSSAEGSLRITWRSITDALMRKKEDGELYLLSWKTCGMLPGDEDARVDMQGVSEAWAIQERLERDLARLADLPDSPYRRALLGFRDAGRTPKIRGIQMGFLVKGARRAAGKEALAGEFSPEQIASGYKLYKTASPLIYGYLDTKAAGRGDFPVPMSWTKEYHCTEPHPMRKSQWYPTGMCEVPGKRHVRGDEWQSFPVWRQPGGVREWIELLDQGKIDPQAGDPMELTWAFPVANFRTQDQLRDWYEQTRARERRIALDVRGIRSLEEQLLGDPSDDSLQDKLRIELNERFPQNVEQCNHWFGRSCPVKSICFGPEHVKQDPLGSGLFRIKTKLDTKKVDLGDVEPEQD